MLAAFYVAGTIAVYEFMGVAFYDNNAVSHNNINKNTHQPE